MIRRIALNKVQRALEAAVLNYGRPLCFQSKSEYRVWCQLEAQAPTQRFRKDVCEDCSLAFKAEMLRLGRCANKHYRPKS